ncbi:protein ANTAGONIST OF LIKE HETEROCHROMATIN PROTEIN 1 [Daphnia magna]|uniref:protein ANTAGONIST OF LIKE HETEROCHROMATIN PROTEIN 1 n=1 Tax=Daphnia magna TaxID=35525 RepID=UPI001E1BBA88|nr:protein ANTAGONIST OF LIKE HETEROCHROMATIN PROTEIN 1 [Daphnia magna]
MRKLISVGERLAITLRYYATGDNLKTIAAGYCVGHDTACKVVVDTGIAIYKVLAPYYLKVPGTSMWRKITIQFSKVWNFPNCIGAIDGKHIAMQAPQNAGSDYFNYKQFHSIILMAICGSQYKFTMIDLGAYGREGDKNVYNTSTISKKLAEGTLGIPPSCILPY